MFGTIIVDAYKFDERVDMAEAIDYLCSPCDNYVWASAGVYCFWDYYKKKVLYIGLAADLSDRFRQHNGLRKVKSNSCKWAYIQDYFKSNDKIGYSILVQSPLSQPITHRNKKIYEGFLDEEFSVENYVGQEGEQNIKLVEGILIEAFRKIKGQIPVWNKIGGSIEGQARASFNSYSLVKGFMNIEPSPFISKCSIRELSDNPKYCWYENWLHGARMMMLSMGGISYLEAIRVQQRFQIDTFKTIDTYKDIENEGYLNKVLKI
ncbi:hypothetical protein [Tepidibacter formicigenes]|jgi:hypothetical protein|uniref:GIY-YIG domain-containing protein n=1 Tax=Tepidibacter formicigenes DSM 15518 TaxID=1123349 RepID=A0A1M6SS95_9FIRM|nr:hypothetical protein [Tepidibacter formicigenes]SHK47591.1 hypothetical protein SAMN02744037_02419 [Tepidibacter formicigenes DSM 15518]